MFFLRARRLERYAPHAYLPGQPAYERLKADLHKQWKAEEFAKRQNSDGRKNLIDFVMGLKAQWRRDWEAEWTEKARIEALQTGRKWEKPQYMKDDEGRYEWRGVDNEDVGEELARIDAEDARREAEE